MNIDRLISLATKYLILSVPLSIIASSVISYSHAYAYGFNYIPFMSYQDYINYSLSIIPRIIISSSAFFLLPIGLYFNNTLHRLARKSYYPGSFSSYNINFVNAIDITKYFYYYLIFITFLAIIFKIILHIYSVSDFVFRIISFILFFSLVAFMLMHKVLIKYFPVRILMYVIRKSSYSIMITCIFLDLFTSSYDDAILATLPESNNPRVTDINSNTYTALEFLERGIVIYDRKTGVISLSPWSNIVKIDDEIVIRRTTEDLFSKP